MLTQPDLFVWSKKQGRSVRRVVHTVYENRLYVLSGVQHIESFVDQFQLFQTLCQADFVEDGEKGWLETQAVTAKTEVRPTHSTPCEEKHIPSVVR